MGQRYYTEKHRISNEQMLAIDQEVSDILTSGYERAVGILALNRESLDRIAEQLMLHETIDSSVLGKYLVESPPVNQP
jgi:ATP-dependent Zn protease